MPKTKLKITKKSLKISRIRGGIWSGNSFLTDSGASFEIGSSLNKKNKLNINFGYNSDTEKSYYRDIEIERYQIIELRDHLNSVINSCIPDEHYYYICIDPRRLSYLESIAINKKSETVILRGYALEVYETRTSKVARKEKEILFNIITTGNQEDILTLPLLKFNRKDRTHIENIYDLGVDEKSKSYFIEEMVLKNDSNGEFIAGVHKLYYISMSIIKSKLTPFEHNEFEKYFMDYGISHDEVANNLINLIG